MTYINKMKFSGNKLVKGKNNNLKVISKYGVGLDMIDLKAAKKFEIPVFNTPGVNQVTVAEHALSLMLTYLKNILPRLATKSPIKINLASLSPVNYIFTQN